MYVQNLPSILHKKSLVRYKTPCGHLSHTVQIYLTGSFNIAEEFALSLSDYSFDILKQSITIHRFTLPICYML